MSGVGYGPSKDITGASEHCKNVLKDMEYLDARAQICGCMHACMCWIICVRCQEPCITCCSGLIDSLNQHQPATIRMLVRLSLDLVL